MIRCEANEKKQEEMEYSKVFHSSVGDPGSNDNQDAAIICQREKMKKRFIKIKIQSSPLIHHYLRLMLEKEKLEHHQKEHE